MTQTSDTDQPTDQLDQPKPKPKAKILPPQHPTMAFPTTITIQPLSEEEIPTFITIELDAFRTHPRIPMLWPRGYTPDLYSYYNSTKIRAFHDPASRFFKAVDGCGKMLAGLQMTISLEPPSTPQDDAPQETKPVNWPEGGNWHMYTFFQQNRRVLVAETFGGQAHTST